MQKQRKSYGKTDLTKIFAVPEELRNQPQWLVWKLIDKGKDKPAKVPYDARTGKPADPTDSKSWCSCAFAVKTYSENPFYAGIGFAFSDSDPYTGIDIDDCVVKETREVGRWAKEIMQLLDSYSEISPSGTGIKIIVKGKVSSERKRTSKIEIYSSKRYFTITGDRIGERPTIEDRQEQLERLYQIVFEEVSELPHVVQAPRDLLKLERVRAIPDEELIRRASRKENFKNLWEGSVAAYADDESRATAALMMMLAYWTRADAERMDRLFRQSKLMRAKWDSRRSGSTWGAKEIDRAVAKQSTFYDPVLDETPKDVEVRNDTSNADLFVSLTDGEFCWLEAMKMWLKWNGVCWSRDADGEVREATRRVMNEIWRRAKAMSDDQIKKADKEVAWAIKSGDAWKRAAIERLARDMLAQPAEEFDREPDLLACRDGVIDLRTGELRHGRREDRLTRSLDLNYEPKAECPLFDQFLSEVMNEDEVMIRYLWRVIGYTLTGDTSERAFFIFHGSGKNGKSTLISVLMSLLGGYAQPARFETFLRKHAQGGANDDIAHLVGARMVVAQESNESQTLDAELVKTLTGGQDLIRARFLYSKEFQFKPTFKLFFITNQVPKINEAAHALWDRIHYIRFAYSVPEEKLDPRLAAKLKIELPGIFAAAVRGELEWRREGLSPPPSVIKGGEELREEMDPVRPFLEDRCSYDEDSIVRQTEIYRAYQEWCKANGVRYPVSSRTLGEHLRNHRFVQIIGAANARLWKGISLKGTLL